MRHALPFKTFSVFSGALLLGVLSAGATAQAQQRKNPLEGQPSIRHKVEMRKNRLEVTPQLVVSVNQDFRHFIGGGAVIQYHATDWLGFAISVAGGGGLDTGLTTNIDKQLRPENDPTGKTVFQPTQEQFRSHLASTQLLLAGYATLTPIAGKLNMFGALYLHYDLYGMGGIGFQRLTNGWDAYPNANKTPQADCAASMTTTDPNSCDPLNSGFKVSGMFGVGFHLYFNQWLGLNVELRDFLNSTNPAGLDVNGDRKVSAADETISNNIFVGVGLTFLLPTTAKISQ